MNDLSIFRRAAAEMRSGSGFTGEFLKFSGEDGHWTCGKDKTTVDDRKLIVAVPDLLVGWQKFKDKQSISYGIGRIADGHIPPPRDELDENDEKRWRNKRDPWQLTYFLGCFDPETQPQFVFATTSAGGRDALANLQDAFVKHNEVRATVPWQWPLIELSSDSYINSFGKKIFVPIFHVLSWSDPPAGFKAIQPPATTPLIATKSNGSDPPSRDEMDDDIPF
jgi:hypothetical protein